MTNHKIAAATLSIAIFLGIFLVSTSQVGAAEGNYGKKEFRYALSLYDRGLYERAQEIFTSIVSEGENIEAEGMLVLCAVKQHNKGYETLIANYTNKYPWSVLTSQIRFAYAQNCFQAQDYVGAADEFGKLSSKQLYHDQVPEFLFKSAYCDFNAGDLDKAFEGFCKVFKCKPSGYTSASHYFAGYILYNKLDFKAAEEHFAVSAKDRRFSEISSYYLLECRFMDKDYQYVVSNGPSMMNSVPKDRKLQLERIISESYLVMGDAQSARKYYEPELAQKDNMSDEDWFYAGSVLYAVQDWAGAAENFSKLSDKTDSIGQVANYELASCYLQMKNKVAALDAFKTASESKVDPVITEDAFYNYAKLAFDLNGDSSVFEKYLKVYSDRKRGERIYAYMAMGALQKRDYATAIEDYDKIEELDSDMKSNYMKANYLRAKELISDGSWRSAVTNLKLAAYYADKREGFNQLCRFWLAEAYFRDGKYTDSRAGFMELYNTAALYGTTEAQLLTYNIAYCYFQDNDYEQAAKWFSEYIGSGSKVVRKEALVRHGDCLFIAKDYPAAVTSYNTACEEYPNVNDIYPYYQSALASGLSGDNNAKLQTLSAVAQANPSSAYYPEATLELGVTYARLGENSRAEECFNRLIANTKDSTFISASLIELGTLAMKSSNNEQALKYYKTVVEQMPVSHYSDDALAAIESVYKSMNDPAGYLAYLDSIGKSSIKSEADRENMFFSSAEQIFISGNYEKALASFNSYIETFPSGTRRFDAEFYIAESHRFMNQLDNARDHYSTVVSKGKGSFLELALLRYSELSYKLQNYSDAYSGYEKLLSSAQIQSNQYVAQLGMMRSAYAGKMYDQAIRAAGVVAKSDESTDAEKVEATYIQAKSYMSTSRRTYAIPLFTQLSANPSTEYGGEAAFILISDSYDRGDFNDVEDRVFAFSESKNPNQYWLAKSFIVLGDSYAELDAYEQAKATFESVRDGYNPAEEDDVKENLDLRIRKLEELISKRNNR